MQRLIAWADGISRFLEIASGALFVLLCVVVLLGVVDRFVVGFGWPWPEEAARFLLVWLTFLTSAVAFRYREHFAVDGLVNLIRSPALKSAISYPVHTIVVVVLLIAAVKGVEMTVIAKPHSSPALGLSMSWVYLSIPIGCALGAFFLIVPLKQPEPSV